MKKYETITSRKKIAKFVRRQMRGSDVMAGMKTGRIALIKDRPRWLPIFLWNWMVKILTQKPF